MCPQVPWVVARGGAGFQGSRRTLAWGSRKLGSRGGERAIGPAYHPKTPPPQPQAGHFLASLEQEEALEVCRKTGSDCRKWVPLFSPSPAWPFLGIAPSLSQQLSSLW